MSEWDGWQDFGVVAPLGCDVPFFNGGGNKHLYNMWSFEAYTYNWSRNAERERWNPTLESLVV